MVQVATAQEIMLKKKKKKRKTPFEQLVLAGAEQVGGAYKMTSSPAVSQSATLTELWVKKASCRNRKKNIYKHFVYFLNGSDSNKTKNPHSIYLLYNFSYKRHKANMHI